MRNYELARLEEIDPIDDGRSPFRPVRHHLGLTAFGVNVFGPHPAGERLINEHDETGPDPQEELYVVLSGRARFEIDGETLEVGPDTFLYARPAAKRTAFAVEDGTAVLAVGSRVGAAYRPMGYELWAPLQAAFDAGDYDAVADRGRELLGPDSPYALPYYNVACAESRAGRADDALAHLGRAFELDEELRAFALEDPDLEPLRDDPRFRELTG